jgi:hypothetical protein
MSQLKREQVHPNHPSRSRRASLLFLSASKKNFHTSLCTKQEPKFANLLHLNLSKIKLIACSSCLSLPTNTSTLKVCASKATPHLLAYLESCSMVHSKRKLISNKDQAFVRQTLEDVPTCRDIPFPREIHAVRFNHKATTIHNKASR